jgi:hypothetical protein
VNPLDAPNQDSEPRIVEEKAWTIRPYDPIADEDGLSYLMAIQYTRSKAGTRANAGSAGKSMSVCPRPKAQLQAEQGFIELHAPLLRWIRLNTNTKLVVDTDDPSVIWAWACTTEPDVIHSVGAKHDVVRSGFADEMIADLLGDRLTKSAVVTLELPQFPGPSPHRTTFPSAGIMTRPQHWYSDLSWLAAHMSQQTRTRGQ